MRKKQTKKSLHFTLFLVLLTFSILLLLPHATATEIKPLVPQFTAQYIDRSYDIPASSHIDPYSGSTVNLPIQHVSNFTIEIAIKNQKYDTSSGVYYNIRAKGHFGNNNWTQFFGRENSPSHMSNSDYTTFVFCSDGDGIFRGKDNAVINAPLGGQVDIQVNTYFGYYEASSNPYQQFGGSWHFATTSGDWSATQTLTIPTSFSSNTPSDQSSLSSFSPVPSSQTQKQTQFGSNFEQITVIALVCIVAGLVVVVAVQQRRLGKISAQLQNQA
jgi:hypothetical protein